MTTKPGPRVTPHSIYALPPTEQDKVAAELAALDWATLAAGTGRTVAELGQLPQLSGIRGTFRTPWRLLAAVAGVGFTGPAGSRGEVIRRLGLSHDKGTFALLAEAADFFGVTLPTVPKDGAPVGGSVLDDDDAVRAAYATAATLTDLARTFGLSPSGKTNDRIRARLVDLGLADLTTRGGPRPRRTPATGRTHGRRPPAATTSTGRVAPGKHYQPWTDTDLGVVEQMYTAGAAAEQIAETVDRTTGAVYAQLTLAGVPHTAPTCSHCGAVLPPGTGRGRKASYCSGGCRQAAANERAIQRNAAEKAAAQGPCEHCQTPIPAGPRTRRFCSKSCAKKAGYRASRATTEA